MKLVNTFLKSAMWLIVLSCLYSCLDETESIDMQSAEDAMRMQQLNAAKKWYDSQKSNGKTGSAESQLQIYKGDPSWKYFAINHKDDFTAIDIDLTDCINLEFVPQDNYDAFQQTGNWEFRRSYTRLVYTFDKKTNKEKGFLMTIIPSKYYAKTYSKRIKRNTYLHRDKYLSGYVLFHRLNGKFANGWEYKRGKVIRKVSMKKRNEVVGTEQVAVRTLLTSYKVTPKVYNPAQTRSDSEGWDVDGGWLPEVEITPDMGWDIDGKELDEVVITPEPEPDWPDWPEPDAPEPEPDTNDGWYWDDEDDAYVPQEPQKPETEFEKAIKPALKELEKRGIDVSKIEIKKGEKCSANARVVNNTIEVCLAFFQWGLNTQTAILWHEIHHLQKDDPNASTKVEPLTKPEVREPPTEIKEMILNEIGTGIGPLDAQYEYIGYVTFYSAFDPIYVQNEINAYNDEIKAFPPETVDEKYANHREIELWQYQEKLDIANTYYKK